MCVFLSNHHPCIVPTGFDKTTGQLQTGLHNEIATNSQAKLIKTLFGSMPAMYWAFPLRKQAFCLISEDAIAIFQCFCSLFLAT